MTHWHTPLPVHHSLLYESIKSRSALHKHREQIYEEGLFRAPLRYGKSPSFNKDKEYGVLPKCHATDNSI